MADFGIKWLGKRVLTLATEANITAMDAAAKTVERDVVLSFPRQGTGKTIDGKWVEGASSKRTKSGKRHKASRAGKPPAIDTGTLRASIMSTVEVKGGNVIGKVGTDIDEIKARSETGTDVEYGLYLELGTRKMQARPFLRPALRRSQAKIKKLFQKANGK